MSYHDECPTTMNVLPDTLATPSTPQTTEWMLHPEAFQSVYQRWWMPNTDQLTTRFNFQSVSPVPDTQTLDVDTLAISGWDWMHMPICLPYSSQENDSGSKNSSAASCSSLRLAKLTVVPISIMSGIYTTTTRLGPTSSIGQTDWFPYRLCLGYTLPLPDWDRLHPLAKLTVVPISIMSGIYTTTTRLGPTSSIGQTDCGSHIDYVWDIHYHYQIGTDFIH